MGHTHAHKYTHTHAKYKSQIKIGYEKYRTARQYIIQPSERVSPENIDDEGAELVLVGGGTTIDLRCNGEVIEVISDDAELRCCCISPLIVFFSFFFFRSDSFFSVFSPPNTLDSDRNRAASDSN
eukprot:m.216726 g.216726  ORF g.216726 m.216726 type:complete len:125 (+) comp13809_c3_seq3:211-585(+)